MSELQFPASLRPIVSKGYGHTSGGNISRTNVQGGMPRQSRDTYYDSEPIKVILVTSRLGRQAFRSFLTKIHGGASSFIMDHDTGLGIQPHNVKITSQVSYDTTDGLNWVIQFTATAERAAIQDSNCLTENLPDLYGCYGDGLNCFLDAYEQYCTSYPFVNGIQP